jgi:hypothetical protein
MELQVALLLLARSGFQQGGEEIAGAVAVLQGVKHNTALALGSAGPGRLLGVGPARCEYSQNLNLAQTYLGGLGWTAWKTPTQELDLKGSFGYIQRLYFISSFNRNLMASTFSESYRNKRRHGVEFREELSFSPAWNNSQAYAAAGKAGLTIPISESFSLDLDSRDSFLNGVPLACRKNSFQFTVDLTYTLFGRPDD